jgi:hypothetical protein
MVDLKKNILVTLLLGSVWVPPLSALEPTQGAVTLHDYEPFTKGPYLVFMAPFNAGSLVRGKDYVDTLTLHTGTFPDTTSITWAWPSDPCPAGIYNFMAMQFGNYNHTHPEVPIPPRRVGNISRLVQRHDLAIGGSLNGFDVVTDFFLTTLAGGDNPHEFEIEIFIHTPKYAVQYVDSSSPIGTYMDAEGLAWTVAIDTNAKDILFMPSDHAAILSATIDIKEMLHWLIHQGTITGSEYFNGLGVGVEVRQNEGSLEIKSFSIGYD